MLEDEKRWGKREGKRREETNLPLLIRLCHYPLPTLLMRDIILLAELIHPLAPLNTQPRLQTVFAIIYSSMYDLLLISTHSSCISPLLLSPLAPSLLQKTMHHLIVTLHREREHRTPYLRISTATLHPHRLIPLNQHRISPLPLCQPSRDSQSHRAATNNLLDLISSRSLISRISPILFNLPIPPRHPFASSSPTPSQPTTQPPPHNSPRA